MTTAHKDSEVMPFLKRYDLAEHFGDHLLVTHEDVAELKPRPEAYIVALARLGMQDHPLEVASLEDTWRGIAAANQAGLRTIAIATTSSSEELAGLDQEKQPEMIVDGFEQLQIIWNARRMSSL